MTVLTPCWGSNTGFAGVRCHIFWIPWAANWRSLWSFIWIGSAKSWPRERVRGKEVITEDEGRARGKVGRASSPNKTLWSGGDEGWGVGPLHRSLAAAFLEDRRTRYQYSGREEVEMVLVWELRWILLVGLGLSGGFLDATTRLPSPLRPPCLRCYGILRGFCYGLSRWSCIFVIFVRIFLTMLVGLAEIPFYFCCPCLWMIDQLHACAQSKWDGKGAASVSSPSLLLLFFFVFCAWPWQTCISTSGPLSTGRSPDSGQCPDRFRDPLCCACCVACAMLRMLVSTYTRTVLVRLFFRVPSSFSSA